MKTSTKKTTPTMADATGLLIPIKLISKIDLNADKTAKKIVKDAKALQERLIDFKDSALDACDEWYNQLLAQLKDSGKDVDSKKGNYTIFSYDRSIKIEVKIGTRLEFDSNINIAKIKIDEYLEAITKDSNSEVATIVQHAFTTSKGKLDAKRVLQLFSLNITNKLWVEAMEMLRQSIKTNITKRYMAIWERDANGEYQPLVLQFSNL
jgi:hypothetical protein